MSEQFKQCSQVGGQCATIGLFPECYPGGVLLCKTYQMQTGRRPELEKLSDEEEKSKLANIWFAFEFSNVVLDQGDEAVISGPDGYSIGEYHKGFFIDKFTRRNVVVEFFLFPSTPKE